MYLHCKKHFQIQNCSESFCCRFSGENLAMQRENEASNGNTALTLSESVTGVNGNGNNFLAGGGGSVAKSSSASAAVRWPATLLLTVVLMATPAAAAALR
jgi:hypothetical protein